MSSNTTSKGFKITLSSLIGVATLISFVVPYLNIVNKVQAQESELSALKSEAKSDHDLLIQVSADIRNIKEDIQEIKRLVK